MASTGTGGQIVWNLDVDDTKFRTGLAKASVEAKSFGSGLSKIDFSKFASQASSAFGSVASGIEKFARASLLVFTASAIGLGSFIKTASGLEKTNAQMTAIIGSGKEAGRVFGELYQYTLGKPIAFPDAAKAAQTLLGYGVSATKVVDSMKALSAFAIVNGSDMSQLALAYGQVNAKGKLMGQEILQLTNNFVPVSQVIAKHFNVSIKEAQQLMEEGKVSAEDFNAAMSEFIPQDKIKEMSNTFNNRMISLQGTLRSTAMAILGIKIDPIKGMVVEAGGLFDRMSQGLVTVAAKLKEWTPAFKAVATFVTDNIGTISAALAALIPMWAVAKVAAIGFGIAGALATGAVTWPVLAVVAAVMALVGVFTFLQLKFDIVGKAMQALKPVITIVKDVLSDLWSSVKELADVLGKELAPVFAFVKKHADVFKKILIVIAGVALAPIIAGFVTLVAGLKVLAVVIRFVAQHFDTIKKVVMAVGAVIFGPLILSVMAAIKIFQFLKDAIPPIWNTVVSVFTAVWNFLVMVWNTIYTVVSTILTAIWTVISTVFNTVWGIIKGVLTLIWNIFVIIFSAIAIVVFTYINLVKTVIMTVFNAIWGFIGPTVMKIWNVISTAFTNVWNTVVTVFNAVKNFIANIWNTIYGILTGIVNRITGFFSGAWNWLYGRGRDIVNGLAGGIRAVAGAVWSAIKTVADQIGNFFGGAGRWLWDTGRALVQGFADGIKSAMGWVADAAKNMANAAKNAAKNALGIRSPSKVFADFGRNIGKGFVEGIASTEDMVSGALGKLVAPGVTVAGNATGSAGSNISNTIGSVNIQNQADADRLLYKLTREEDIYSRGLISNV